MRRRLRDVGSRLAGTRPAAPADSGVTEATPSTAEQPHDGGDAAVPPAPDAQQEEPVTQVVEVDQVDQAVEAVEPTAAAPVAVEPDAVLAAAVEVARAVAVEVAGGEVGDHLGVEADDAFAVTHSFAALERGYVGWRWAVTVARADGSDEVTVDEVVLLPGSGALLAPAWVPWSERVQPGDLAPGDLLPTAPDDPRLVPAYEDTEQEDLLFALQRELGLGRERVLSLEGRELAAERWYEGDAGPRSPLAKAAPAPCRSCGFLVPLGGGLARVFGVCANGYAPDDGRVVALDHGCGAHSSVAPELTHVASGGLAVADEVFEPVVIEREPAAVGSHDPAADHADEPLVTPEGEAALPYGHS
jgi:hypothetical protein